MRSRIPTSFKVAVRHPDGGGAAVGADDELIVSPDVVVRMEVPGGGHVVDAEFVRAPDGEPVLTGLLIRTSPRNADSTAESELVPLSAREVKRLPLVSCIRTLNGQARFAFSGLFNVLGWASEEAHNTWRKKWDAERLETARTTSDAWVPRSSLPRGRPAKGRSTRWYRDFAAVYQQLQAAGVPPAREIARRKDVPVNTVYQWVHRTRSLGFLPPAAHEKRRGSSAC